MNTIQCTAALFFCLTSLFSGDLFAQTATDSNSDQNSNSSVVIYDSNYFAHYNVINATDMLRRIPGVASILDSQDEYSGADVRGFGSGGDQILINGKRIAGKTNDISDALERIQASRVKHIELIRGTSAEVNVRSEGLILNIVVDETVNQNIGSWRGGGGVFENGHFNPQAYLSYAGKQEALSYFMSAELDAFYEMEEKREHYFMPALSLDEKRRENESFDHEEYKLTTNLIYRFSNTDELRLNGLVARQDGLAKEKIRRLMINQIGGVQLAPTEFRRNQEETLEWELGADYQHAINDRTKLELLAIYSFKAQDSDQVQRSVLGDADVITTIDDTETVDTEVIIRGAYQIQLNKKHDIEIGFEGAQNKLDTDFQIFAPDPSGDLASLDVFNPDAIVEEWRYEFFGTHIWNIKPGIALESGVNFEYSEIEQDGTDIQASRDFSYIKPRFDLRIDLTPRQQLRMKIERTVSQLDFGEFVASFDPEFDRLDAGNPQLEPEKAWHYELSYEHRLVDDQGVIKGNAFYKNIEDHMAVVAVSDTRSTPGNIGDAKHYGLEFNASVRLSWLGMSGAVLSASYLWQDSEVTDPFTGNKRKVNDLQDYGWTLGFRHDLGAGNFSYGMDVAGEGPSKYHDIDLTDDASSQVELEVFLEAKIWKDLVLRIEGSELTGSKYSRYRTRGIIPEGVVHRTERFDELVTRGINISLRGKF